MKVILLSHTSVHVLLLSISLVLVPVFCTSDLFCVSTLRSFVHDPSGFLFLLRSAVPSVPAAWLHLVLRHFTIYWSGERKAIGGWHRIALASHLQHYQNLANRFVAMCSSCHPITPSPATSLPCPLCSAILIVDFFLFIFTASIQV